VCRMVQASGRAGVRVLENAWYDEIMPVNSLHPEYEAHEDWWRTLRDVIAGDRAVKRSAVRYIPRLDGQTDLEYRAYVERGFFYNATARTVLGYLGMIFRREPRVIRAAIGRPNDATPRNIGELAGTCDYSCDYSRQGQKGDSL